MLAKDVGGNFIGGKKDRSSESDSDPDGTRPDGTRIGGSGMLVLGGFLDNTFANVSIVFFKKSRFLLVNCDASSHQLW